MAHYCVEHQQAWFKKGAMKSYAHPIKNEEGVTTGWCNEPKVEGEAFQEPSSQPLESISEGIKPQAGGKPWGKPAEEVKSIQNQVALKACIELVVADKIKVAEIDQMFTHFSDLLAGKTTLNPASVKVDIEKVLKEKGFEVEEIPEKGKIIPNSFPKTEQLSHALKTGLSREEWVNSIVEELKNKLGPSPSEEWGKVRAELTKLGGRGTKAKEMLLGMEAEKVAEFERWFKQRKLGH